LIKPGRRKKKREAGLLLTNRDLPDPDHFVYLEVGPESENE
jgi:hypothetical protein